MLILIYQRILWDQDSHANAGKKEPTGSFFIRILIKKEIMMIHEKEIWLGFSESPADYFDDSLSFKEARPFIITKVYSGTSLIRVTEASTNLKQKYIIDVELNSGKVLQFDKYSSYIINVKSLKQKLKPLIGPTFDKKYKYIKR
ncbi:hypothetical protein EELLY_v1c02300 [Entomoplasma ellychniae]|uniref:Uncharacterized protein n=1 Tax=Entomoplasma ellychniae TaxID=2114 RepID=A0A8E2QXS4_9MOLU|nr:hypothetical protein [Entomoplasma ellychniae]PPE04550.1 hypothetical protein EELLY_v1c02300 [Entomoplasma ellychniae]